MTAKLTCSLDPSRSSCDHFTMMRLMFCIAVVLSTLSLGVSRGVTQEYVAVPDVVSDEAFYRMVACAAPPGLECNKPFIRWPEDRRLSLTVGLAQVTPVLPNYKYALFDRAIDAAIDEINAAGAQIFLERSYETGMDIPFHIVATAPGDRITGTQVPELEGVELSIGRVALRSRGGDITGAAIAISAEIRRREIASVVLEELVQALGLVTDVVSPAYESSIFSETSNSTVWLRGQDLAVLRRHYPRVPLQ